MQGSAVAEGRRKRDDEPRSPRHRLGKDGLEYFSGLIGGPPFDWELEKAALKGLEVEFSLVKGPRRLEWSIKLDRTGGLLFSSRAPSEELSQEELLLVRTMAEGASATRFADLLARLKRDSLLYSDPQGSCVASRFETYYRRVDHSPDFWKFVYPQARFLEQEVSFGARYFQVSHATLECRLNNPLLAIGLLRLFADDNRVRSDGDYGYVDTSITEADVVGGRTQEILGRTLERVARDEKPAFIHLKTTCLPELIGDNPKPFIDRIEGELGVPVLWTSKTHAPGPAYEDMIEKMIAGTRSSAKVDPRAVLLAGVPTAAAGREAGALCEALGLRVVGTLFPNLDFDKAPAMGAAGAVVWLNPVGWEKIEDGVFLRRGLRVVRYHPPYGHCGTRGWLERVSSVLGLEGDARVFESAQEERADAFAALGRECRRRTVALIGDRIDIGLFASVGSIFGFSVAGLLCDLGFNVRCLVWSAEDGGRARSLRRPKTASGQGTIEFDSFSSRDELDRALGRGIDLVFSHFNHDPRLEAHALPGFTEQVFEPGLDGLLRTGRRLLTKCEARPFPRHRAYLKPWQA
ncbi:MAG: hypothetical protein A2X40_04060 [Elusimicrobia bacterium GWC2_65_9]|nr:MAG: hypothetical protein A2X37_05115 [Elusimicrobia bacterium GWA2_66_18]OGR76932.1 MAG: hypothetical protein A2X40_04060 [Elusimicrobia bacterium GWC2_65_9]